MESEGAVSARGMRGRRLTYRTAILIAVIVSAALAVVRPQSASADTVTPQFAVNAGGGAIGSSSPAWSADTAGSPSSFVNAAATGNTVYTTPSPVDMTDPSVPAGTPMAVFQSERYADAGGPNMTWTFPAPAGSYQVKLFIAEIYFTQPGQRVFNAAINGTTVLTNYDTVADVGPLKGVVKTFPVTTTTANPTITITFTHVVENPAIKGIELLSSAPSNQLAISASPALYPAFSTDVPDYVVRCTAGSPISFFVSAPPGGSVSVDGQQAGAGSFITAVTLDTGQGFPIAVDTGGSQSTYYVRCLPADFPTWTATRTGSPQAEWYELLPRRPGSTSQQQYITIVDTNGVPVWWMPTTGSALYGTMLSDGSIAYTDNDENGVEIRRLDGTLVRLIVADGGFDAHDVRELPNGDFLITVNQNRSGVDLSSWGGSSDDTVVDQIFEEIAPDGTVVWTWDTLDHISVTETDPQWWPQLLASSGSKDAFHWNSMDVAGDDIVVSYRHLDAVYRINRTTGDIEWKLGGSQRPESLSVVDDPVFAAGGDFGGPHDARLLPDGTLTIHDDGTGRGRSPRAVRYSLDLTARTATLLESVTSPGVTSSGCCGSARRLPGGDWVMGWGGTPHLFEQAPDGSVVFHMTMQSPLVHYRAEPILPGTVTRAALRLGMDAQYPRVPPTD